MKTTFEKMTASSKQYLKDNGFDSKDYEERDRECEQLTRKFYEVVGLGVNGEFERMDDLDVGESDAAEERAKEIKGWSQYLDEEVEYLWKDGVEIGRMLVSCRGGSYAARMHVGDKTYSAQNETKGEWI